MRRSSFAFATIGLVSTLAGCDCGGAPNSTSCVTRTPASNEPRTIGALTLTPDDHRLTIVGLPPTVRLVVGRGPALGTEPIAPVLDAVQALNPDLVVLHGGLGEGERLRECIETFSTLTVPVLVVPGPRDAVDALDEAIAAGGSNIVSLLGVHVVDVGATQLVVLAGVEGGRYGVSGACGFDAEDAASVLAAADPSRPRFLLATQAPAGRGALTRGLDGGEAGSAVLAAALGDERVGGLFAWPDTDVGHPRVADAAAPAGRSLGFSMIVPAMMGPAIEGSDGARAPSGPIAVELGPDGAGIP